MQGEVPNVTLQSDTNFIEYATDNSTSYAYAPFRDGFDQKIVIDKYTGQTDFKIRVYTNGLSPTQSSVERDYFFIDDTGELKISPGDTMVFTADERNNTFGKMTYETIIADEEYLRDERTLYPIKIDGFGVSNVYVY